LGARFGLAVSLAQAEQAIGAEIKYYRAHLDQGRDDAHLAQLRVRCADILSQELELILHRKVPTGPEMVEALLASLSFTAFPDAHPVLSELRALGLRLVVVSNWDVSLGEVLGRLGLSECLDAVVTSAAVGVGKPAREIFERGLSAADAGASEAVHVGDSLREDVDGARAAGIEPVLVNRQQTGARRSGPEILTVRTLLELPRLVSSAHG
jgi:putative hydrolase of the HAD superfamily